MEPWQQRVVEEKKELDEKLVKLHDFISGETFKSMDWPQATMLKRQRAIMRDYSAVLAERIKAFSK